MKLGLSCLLLVFLACSCAVPSTQTRISKNGGMYSLLSAKHRELVAAGQITQGMSKDAVYLAWGTPSKVFKFEKQGVTKERWVYTRSKSTHSTSIGIGVGSYPRYSRYGYHGCIDYGPRTVYVSEQVAEVIFHGDQVESWERKQ